MKKSLMVVLVFAVVVNVIQGQMLNPVKWTYSLEKNAGSTVTMVFTAQIDKPWHMYGLYIAEGGPIPVTFTFEDNKAISLVGTVEQVTRPEVIDDPVFGMKVELHSHKAVFRQKIQKLKPQEDIQVKGTISYMTCNDTQCVMNDTDFSILVPGSAVVSRQPLQVSPEQKSSKVPLQENPLPKSSKVPAQESTVQAYPQVPAQESTIQEFSRVSMQEDSVKAVNAETLRIASPPADITVKEPEGSAQKKRGLLGTFLISLLAGLGGLLTPCVYPMIPLTVAFFLRGDKPRSRAIAEALVFGFSIVFIYTLIGILVAVFKNPNAVNAFITHWLTNLIFALIFIVLAASFFGLFELVLPGSLSEKVDRQADKGGFAGAFFMALAMAILSFSCTGPIIASLLITAAQGEVLEPVIGMLGFSVAFALPFTLFAVFPSWLQSLPKSGGWMNAVKVFFAFVMLAFSMYFLAKVDQAYHLDILSREVFLIIWVVLFSLLGLYLLGKIRFAHDSELQHMGVIRLLFVIASFSFALYLFTGLLGHDLKGISSLLPPKQENPALPADQPQYTVSPDESVLMQTGPALCSVPAYADFLSFPHGIQGYFDYEEALACAREKNKPLLVDFVGHTCANCKKMYELVWSDPRVQQILRNDYVVVALYTDDKTRLPEKDWIVSSYDGKTKNTIGKKNQDFQITRFNSNALPLYAIVDGHGNELTSGRYTYSPDVEKFIRWLREGISNKGQKEVTNNE